MHSSSPVLRYVVAVLLFALALVLKLLWSPLAAEDVPFLLFFIAMMVSAWHAEQRLRQSEGLYRSIIEQATESIFLVDPETKRILAANGAFYHWLGYTPEELRQLTLYDLVAHDPGDIDNTRYLQTADLVFLGKRKYRHRDGSLRDVEVSVSTVPYGRKEVQCVVAHDITERKQAEENLRHSLSMLLALYEAGRVLGSTLELDEVGLRLLEIMRDITGLTAGVIRTRDEEGRWPAWQSIGPEPLLHRARFSSAASSAREAALKNEGPVHFRLPQGEAEGELSEEGLMGLCLPFRTRERGRGILLEAYGAEDLAEEETIEILTSLTNQAASALENARLYRDLVAREHRLQALVGRLIGAQEEERRRVAYEVHDSLAQMVASAHQRLQAYAGRYPPSSQQSKEDLDRIISLGQQSVREARRIIANLRPTALDDFGISVAVSQEIQRLRDEGWVVEYEQKLGDGRLPSMVETAVFRVAQEALTNARKHAQTRRLRVELSRDDRIVRLRVRDWGQGFDPGTLATNGGPGERVGISGMRERVALLGGEFKVESRPGEGTVISLDIPLLAAERS